MTAQQNRMQQPTGQGQTNARRRAKGMGGMVAKIALGAALVGGAIGVKAVVDKKVTAERIAQEQTERLDHQLRILCNKSDRYNNSVAFLQKSHWLSVSDFGRQQNPRAGTFNKDQAALIAYYRACYAELFEIMALSENTSAGAKAVKGYLGREMSRLGEEASGSGDVALASLELEVFKRLSKDFGLLEGRAKQEPSEAGKIFVYEGAASYNKMILGRAASLPLFQPKTPAASR